MRGPIFLVASLLAFALAGSPVAWAQQVGGSPTGTLTAIAGSANSARIGDGLARASTGTVDVGAREHPLERSGAVCKERGLFCKGAAALLFVGYLTILLVGRYAWVVEPNNAHLRAQAKKLRARLKTEAIAKENNPADGAGVIAELIDAAVGGESSSGIGRQPPKQGFIPQKTPFFAWSVAFTGKQLAAWRLLHEAERLAVDYYPESVLRDQARVALEKLRDIRGPHGMLQQELSSALCSGGAGGRNGNCDDERPIKPLLKEAKAAVYREEDVRFEALAAFQNKAFWLIIASLSSVVGLAVSFIGAPVLLMAGATGGLLARLRKVIDRRGGRFDYGMSWSVLFLTPLVGALTGWIGTAIFQILLEWDLLGEQFGGVDVFSPNLVTVVVALAFGLSATLFDKFVEKIEESIVEPEPSAREGEGSNDYRQQVPRQSVSPAKSRRGKRPSTAATNNRGPAPTSGAP
jgi:hypothetical protein